MAGEHTTTAIAEGLTMPLLGLGVWQAAEGAQTSRAVGWALFLTTKFRPGRRDPERELGASLRRLGLEALLAVATIAPAVNQVQFSPFQFRRALLDACRRNGIVLEAYSPLTHGRDLAHPTIAEIAARVGRTPAQVLLRWAIQRDIPAIPKSVHRERIIENAQVFGFTLHDDDLGTLDALDRTGGTGRARERPWW